MANDRQVQEQRIDQFFSGPGARADSWRFLVDAAKAWSKGSVNRNKFDALLAQDALHAADRVTFAVE